MFGPNLLLGEPPFCGLLYVWFLTNTNEFAPLHELVVIGAAVHVVSAALVAAAAGSVAGKDAVMAEEKDDGASSMRFGGLSLRARQVLFTSAGGTAVSVLTLGGLGRKLSKCQKVSLSV